MSFYYYVLGKGLRSSDYERLEIWPMKNGGFPDTLEWLPRWVGDRISVEAADRLGLRDLDIVADIVLTSEDERNAYYEHSEDAAGCAWVWRQTDKAKPPAVVAAALRRLRAAVLAGDPDAYQVVLIDRTTEEPRRTDVFIEDLDELLSACDTMVAAGVPLMAMAPEPL